VRDHKNVLHRIEGARIFVVIDVRCSADP